MRSVLRRTRLRGFTGRHPAAAPVLAVLMALLAGACDDATRSVEQSESMRFGVQAAADQAQDERPHALARAASAALPFEEPGSYVVAIIDDDPNDPAAIVEYTNGREWLRYRFEHSKGEWRRGARLGAGRPATTTDGTVSTMNTGQELATIWGQWGGVLVQWTVDHTTPERYTRSFTNSTTPAFSAEMYERTWTDATYEWSTEHVLWEARHPEFNTLLWPAREWSTTFTRDGQIYGATTLILTFELHRRERPRVTSVTVTPSGPAIDYGSSTTLTARAYDQNGAEMTGLTATWASGNSSIAPVSSTGPMTASVSGQSLGTATITATVSGVLGSATVTVHPALELSGPSYAREETVTITSTVSPSGTYYYDWDIDWCVNGSAPGDCDGQYAEESHLDGYNKTTAYDYVYRYDYWVKFRLNLKSSATGSILTTKTWTVSGDGEPVGGGGGGCNPCE